jgi:mRNA-degrading endonuclease toxin of MazEF toxin-antitoxin module
MRGDIVELRVDPHGKGHEQRERHYVVVLQSDTVSSLTVVAAPTTTGMWDVSFHPKIEFNGEPALVLIEQMTVMDPAIRFGRKVGRVSPAEQVEIDRAAKLALGLF